MFTIKDFDDVQPTNNDAHIVIPSEIYHQFQELCIRSRNNEVGCFGTVERNGNQITITEIFLPDQTVGPVTVDITGLDALGTQLIEEGREDVIDKLHLWWHCHPGDSVHPSGTDEATYSRLTKNCPDMIMGIFSKDAQTAYFRLRHHGMNVAIPWKVVHSNGDKFADFNDKVEVIKTKEFIMKEMMR